MKLTKKNLKTNKLIMFLISALSFMLLISLVVTYKQKHSKVSKETLPTPTQVLISDGFFTKITPTIIQLNNNKEKFIHPQNDFSFEYPANWNLLLKKQNYSDNWYDVQLTNGNQNSFRIYFEVNGRDYPHYREVKEKKVLGGKNITWTTLYNNHNEAVEAFTSFPNNNFGDKLLGLYIYLPKDNQKEFIKQVEELIASLK